MSITATAPTVTATPTGAVAVEDDAPVTTDVTPDVFDSERADAEMGPVGLFFDPATDDGAGAEAQAVPGTDVEPTVADVDGPDTDAGAPGSPSPLAAACAAGTVRLFKERGTGTLRRLPFLVGPAREVAEYYALRRDQGAAVRAIAEECATSKATVRRLLSALLLTEAIEDGDHDDLWSDDLTELIFSAEEDDE